MKLVNTGLRPAGRPVAREMSYLKEASDVGFWHNDHDASQLQFPKFSNKKDPSCPPKRGMLGAEELRVAYAASDLFVSASTCETLGNTVVEVWNSDFEGRGTNSSHVPTAPMFIVSVKNQHTWTDLKLITYDSYMHQMLSHTFEHTHTYFECISMSMELNSELDFKVHHFGISGMELGHTRGHPTSRRALGVCQGPDATAATCCCLLVWPWAVKNKGHPHFVVNLHRIKKIPTLWTSMIVLRHRNVSRPLLLQAQPGRFPTTKNMLLYHQSHPFTDLGCKSCHLSDIFNDVAVDILPYWNLATSFSVVSTKKVARRQSGCGACALRNGRALSTLEFSCRNTEAKLVNGIGWHNVDIDL